MIREKTRILVASSAHTALGELDAVVAPIGPSEVGQNGGRG